ncbi:AraC family transcriptional regulator [Paenibacillus sp. MBLB2552]|uniref:AraC family transcriptional regulator n=1 Tax=Paenibacillus mellifer TaxID=2937794 RepID=A0A9X2BSW2_9BACL|nr:AraC family transcriptional regulator [Paenibacillus mellifer]MCK8487236.1 AraC family transcriptional regulator [Paenibacillus mellifer]
MDNQIRKPDGFDAQKLFVQPDYMLKELNISTLTRPLFVSDIGFFPHARHHFRERPEGADAHIFIYCVEGEGWVEWSEESSSTDRSYPLTERQLAVVPAGTPHRYGASADKPWSIYWFHLQGEDTAELIRTYGLDQGGPVRLPLSVHAQLLEQFEQCYRLLYDKHYSLPAQIHVAQTMRHLLSSIGLSAERSAQARKRERYFDEAVRYMTERLTESVSLPELAKQVGVSKQHLVYLFNREAGLPPIEYFLRLKMQRAGQLLDLTGLSVKEIAGAVGLSDPYYFSRLFKKIMGYSPTEYRGIPKG